MVPIIAGLVILGMIAGCYILSGFSLIEGTIFERKSTVKHGVAEKK